MKKVLAVLAFIGLLSYAGFYLLNGISSGDHWKFVHTFIGLFLSALLLLWFINLNRSPQQKSMANRKIKIAIVVAAIVVAVIIQGYLMLVMLGFSEDS